jgi:capsular polysaccharide biosynthesis protein
MRSRRDTSARPVRRSILAGLALAVLLLAAGGAVASTQHKTFTAEAVLVALPRSDLDAATTAAFYETMSRGQIIGTFAEVANNAVYENQAMDDLGLTPGQRSGISSEVTVVPDTSVMLVRVTGDAATTAEQVCDRAAARITAYLTGMSDAYRVQVVHRASGSAVSSGMSPQLVLVLAAVVALVLGLALQQIVYHLGSAQRLSVGDGFPRADPSSAVPPAVVVPAPPRREEQSVPAGRA